jgi:hypothetical protein
MGAATFKADPIFPLTDVPGTMSPILSFTDDSVSPNPTPDPDQQSSSVSTTTNTHEDRGDSTSISGEMIVMTWNRGASMCDKGASIYETDTDSDSDSDDEIDTVTEEPDLLETKERGVTVERNINGFSVVLFWLTRLLLGGRVTRVWQEWKKPNIVSTFSRSTSTYSNGEMKEVCYINTGSIHLSNSSIALKDESSTTTLPDFIAGKADILEEEADWIKPFWIAWEGVRSLRFMEFLKRRQVKFKFRHQLGETMWASKGIEGAPQECFDLKPYRDKEGILDSTSHHA